MTIINYNFRPPDSVQTSLDFVAVVKYATAPGGDCIQIGRFQYLGGNGDRCTNYYDWPDDWNSGVLNGNTYEASIDVSSVNYSWPAGVYTVSSTITSNKPITLILLLSVYC